MRMLRLSWIVTILFLTLALAAGAQEWTAVGTTGAIDESSLGVFSANDAVLFYAAGGSLTNIVSRFNVVNTSGSSVAPWTTLEMASRDGTPLANVTATLFRVPKCSGTAIAVCSALSSETSTSPTCTSCTISPPLDFANNNYFVQVVLNRSSSTASPQLYGLRIF